MRDSAAHLRAALPARPGRPAGTGCVVIGEVAQSHDGSLGLAHAFLDAIADAGADAVKFQTHIASAESTPAEPWRVKFSPQDATRYDYWKRMEFSEEGWKGLKSHADERGLWFLSSPFSDEAAALLSRVGVAAWKIASGETSNLPLLERLLADGRPVLLSTGLSALEEVDAAAALVKAASRTLAVLQCTSAYPCPLSEGRTEPHSVLPRAATAAAVGLSDHSGTVYLGSPRPRRRRSTSSRSTSRSPPGYLDPTSPRSVTCDELRQLVEGSASSEWMAAHPVDKRRERARNRGFHTLFTKSVVALRGSSGRDDPREPPSRGKKGHRRARKRLPKSSASGSRGRLSGRAPPGRRLGGRVSAAARRSEDGRAAALLGLRHAVGLGSSRQKQKAAPWGHLEPEYTERLLELHAPRRPACFSGRRRGRPAGREAVPRPAADPKIHAAGHEVGSHSLPP